MRETGAFREFRKAFNQLTEFVLSLAIHQGINIKRRRTAIGTTLIGTASGEGSAGGMTFKGTWAAGVFAFNDVVKIESGIHAGTYVAIESVSATDPSPHLSDKWVLLGRVNDNGITSG